MRLQFKVPRAEEVPPEAQDWQVIRAPGARMSFWLAAVVGFVLITGLCVGLGLLAMLPGHRGAASAGDNVMSWLATVVVLVVYIPLHELLHLVGQPGGGRSDRSVVLIQPAKLRFGVYYEGDMSRRRWLAMRLLPFVVLSILPAGLLALSQVWRLGAELEVALEVLMTVNTLGSGADILAAFLVLRQVPASGQLVFRAGRAFWRPA